MAIRILAGTMQPTPRVSRPTVKLVSSTSNRERAQVVPTRRRSLVNDTHSALNRTLVSRIIEPRSAEDVSRAIKHARANGRSLAIAGGRHAMGGQQFLAAETLLDMRRMNRVRKLDDDRGLLDVEAGITWPDVIRGYLVRPYGVRSVWGIRQKQTGADRLTIGGAVAANIHGRCLAAGPFIDDIESLEVVTSDGNRVTCNRTQRPELFRHVIGGFGLFGVVTAATLRLVPRVQVERVVTMTEIDSLIDTLEARIAEGYLYGDFQFATDPAHESFLRTGVLSCYRPTDSVRAIPQGQRRLTQADWNRLLELAHVDKRRAFEEFASFYLATSGQLYWSDTHQLNLYLESYHGALDQRLGRGVRGSEMITEIYVPRHRLAAFMDDVRKDFRANSVDFIYGTIRLIEKDTASALPWARDRYACVIFILHIDHLPRSIVDARACFTRLINKTLAHSGSYYLTYHRFARRDQVLACHPRITSFLTAKKHFDPRGVFQSDWYRHLVAQLDGDGSNRLA